VRSATITWVLACLPVVATAQLVPESFAVPKTYSTPSYQLVPLGPAVAELDYKAYMSSVEHIRKSQGGNWPRPDLTMADQAKDMAGEQAQWDARKSFPFAVLTPDGTKELGCFYLRPSAKEGYDAVATMWVIKEEFDKGFEDRLYRDMKEWLARSWPFQKVAWVGREIPRDQWRALPNKAARK
jgi:hypothetical protein